ncbi:MAG: hypothetical protein A2550_00040 [Candidatus Jacksonbacteria bacterium RIFOXYD2_FULL_43_21]|nr:MAG: hypothetical protein A2550_00040 [Candidatus Jacksonbacteria bacterium RIFOXYD2_FULL_43_21]
MSPFYPIKLLADWLTIKILQLSLDTHLGEAVHFFIYDSIKIFILLLVIIFAVSLMRTYFPPNKIRQLLAHKNQFTGHLAAAGVGIITPFCTCSAIPLFLGLLEAGVPLGVTMSFLIASPLINEVALVLLWGMFGWQIALIYIFSGYLIAVLSGFIIGRLKLEALLTNLPEVDAGKIANRIFKPSWRERLKYSKNYTFQIIRQVWPYVLIGLSLGTLIHGYVPTDFLARYAGADKWYAVPLATLIGIPLYGNPAGVIPLVNALTEKGVAMGTVLAFMMAVTALSLPEFMILKKVMRLKLIIIFAGIVGVGIMLTGYLFNWIL